MMLLLTANPLHPFTSPLLSLVLKLFPFQSFVQKKFLILSLHRVFFLKTSPSIFLVQIPVMSQAKDEGSSCCKGKEVVADDPPAKTMGKEVPLSKSNLSGEEKGGRDPNNECLPLVDSWYNTHIHFPVVPDDYFPPLLGRVWLSICYDDMKVSWAPLASSILDLDIRQGTSLLVPILFEFGLGTSLCWKEWVDEELSDTGFMAVLQ